MQGTFNCVALTFQFIYPKIQLSLWIVFWNETYERTFAYVFFSVWFRVNF